MKHLFKSLASFQQEIPAIIKNSQGYGYEFADLPAIFEKINPLLKKHGLGFTQLIEGQGLKTIVFHCESGELIESVTDIPTITLKGMNDYQSFGSGVTYYRRYALSAMLGLVTDKDVDGAGVQTKEKPTLSDDRFKAALKAIAEGKTKKETVINQFNLTSKQNAELQAIN